MQTLEFLPIRIENGTTGDIGLALHRPVGGGINRMLRWWKVKTWQLDIDMDLGTATDPVIQFNITRQFQFKNHELTPRISQIQFVPTSTNDLFVRRYTDVDIPDGGALSRFRLFHPDQDEAIYKVGTLYYPYIDLVYQFVVPVGPASGQVVEMNMVTGDRPDTYVMVSIDNQRVLGLSSDSNIVRWAGGSIALSIIDFWY